ncbi:hypothetical protein BYT27DRAFT_7189565 [Phlegmacium glaucopus]|nr:hypothetical protein BYT27DRAFT_7189565 [Phlegmacium glaucopus]
MPNDQGHVLHYNINWMDSVFRSRTRTEALLSPERESGNLTTRDYEAAIQFLPGTHHYYPIIGLAVGTAIGMAFQFRYPRLSAQKRIFVFLGTVLTGRMVGKLQQVSAHTNYLRDIENPDGYKRAMENIQKGLGLPVHRGLVIGRSYQISPDASSPQQISENGPELMLPSSSSESSPSPDSSLSEKSHSRWDQIRAANSRTAQNSTWDALRQQHEKTRVKPKTDDRDDDKWSTSEG